MIDPALSEEMPITTGRTLRQFAALSLVFFGSQALWQGLVRHHGGLAAVLAILTVFPGAIGLVWPERIRTIYALLVRLTMPIGRVVSLVLLAGLFYLVMTPLGVLVRLSGRDSLHLRRPKRTSHWVEKPAVTDLKSYIRQS